MPSMPLFLRLFAVTVSPMNEGVEQLDPEIEPQTQWAVENGRPVNARNFIPASGNTKFRCDGDLR